MGEWQPIETAPHGQRVLLAWAEDYGWHMEVAAAAWGWRRGEVSNMSLHGRATHWQPLPAPPAQRDMAEGGR